MLLVLRITAVAVGDVAGAENYSCCSGWCCWCSDITAAAVDSGAGAGMLQLLQWMVLLVLQLVHWLLLLVM